jgi:hypothetical protein
VASIDGVPIRGDMVTLTGAATRLGVERGYLDVYWNRARQRPGRHPFPGPVAEVAGVSLWRWVDVEGWQAGRVAPS